MTFVVKDSNGTPLQDGDSVQLIKDLKLRGSSKVYKRGTTFKNISVIEDNTEEIETREGIVLRVEFVKKK